MTGLTTFGKADMLILMLIGTVIMYGNIVGEYIEQPVFGPECPEYDQTSGKFIRF